MSKAIKEGINQLVKTNEGMLVEDMANKAGTYKFKKKLMFPILTHCLLKKHKDCILTFF